jgi:DNA-binding GntR family transcriptional regulator
MSESNRSTYERLKDDILQAVLAPGTRLVETQLAERYRVSRTPVREALSQLGNEGLVERTDRGMRVRQPAPEEMFELYEVREILETAAARLAAQRHTELDAMRLSSLLERMEAPDLTTGQRISLNREFHAAIAKASHNKVLFDALDRLYTNSVRQLNTTLTSDGRWRRSIVEHGRMVEAIIRRDAEEASRLLSEHLRTARDIRLGVHSEAR